MVTDHHNYSFNGILTYQVLRFIKLPSPGEVIQDHRAEEHHITKTIITVPPQMMGLRVKSPTILCWGTKTYVFL